RDGELQTDTSVSPALAVGVGPTLPATGPQAAPSAAENPCRGAGGPSTARPPIRVTGDEPRLAIAARPRHRVVDAARGGPGRCSRTVLGGGDDARAKRPRSAGAADQGSAE